MNSPTKGTVMTITLQRMERLRRARSLNDILSIGKEVGKDITRANNISMVLSGGREAVTAASIKFNHSKISELPKKLKVGPAKKKTGADAKMGQKLASFKAPPM